MLELVPRRVLEVREVPAHAREAAPAAASALASLMAAEIISVVRINSKLNKNVWQQVSCCYLRGAEDAHLVSGQVAVLIMRLNTAPPSIFTLG